MKPHSLALAKPMLKTQTKNAKGARASDRRMVRIAVSLTPKQFDAVKHQAIVDNRSISDVIRDYVDVGLMVDQDEQEAVA